jgi:hypothetical protein
VTQEPRGCKSPRTLKVSRADHVLAFDSIEQKKLGFELSCYTHYTVLPWTHPTVPALLAMMLVACGGKAHGTGTAGTDPPSTAGAGGSQLAPAAGEAGAPTMPEPSVVRVVGEEGEGSVDSSATAGCLGGFHGFEAVLGEELVTFHAFVSEAGDYTGDPLRLLWLEVTGDGKHYLASCCASNFGGEIFLHVDAVEPRFMGELEAVLADQDDPNGPPLRLQLTFDIAVRAGCPR